MKKEAILISALSSVISTLFVNAQSEATGCLGDVQFTVVDDSLTFDEAAAECENKGALLGGIQSFDEHEFVIGLARQLNIVHGQSIWLGTLLGA